MNGMWFRSHKLGVEWLKSARLLNGEDEEAILRHSIANYGKPEMHPGALQFKDNKEATGFLSALDLIRTWPDGKD